MSSETAKRLLRGVQGTEITNWTAENVMLLVTSCSVRKVRYRHINQYFKFQRLLELLVVSCPHHSPTQRKRMCLFEC